MCIHTHAHTAQIDTRIEQLTRKSEKLDKAFLHRLEAANAMDKASRAMTSHIYLKNLFHEVTARNL